MDRLQTTATDQIEKARDQASILAGQARKGLERSGEALISFEQAVARNFRANRSIYAVAGAALLALLAAKWLLDRREQRERQQS